MANTFVLAFLVPFTFLPKMATERSITRENAAFLLSIIGKCVCNYQKNREEYIFVILDNSNVSLITLEKAV